MSFGDENRRFSYTLGKNTRFRKGPVWPGQLAIQECRRAPGTPVGTRCISRPLGPLSAPVVSCTPDRPARREDLAESWQKIVRHRDNPRPLFPRLIDPCQLFPV